MRIIGPDIVYPVIHFSFGAGSAYESTERLTGVIEDTLNEHAQKYGVDLPLPEYGRNFNHLIRELYNKYKQKVVILVDEYDKQMLLIKKMS